MVDIKCEEYKHLYSEISRNSQIFQNVFLSNISITAAMIGYGLSNKEGSIFLAPLIIIIPSLFFLASQLESTIRIATYIQVFFEEGSDELNWETKLFQLKEKGFIPSRNKYLLSTSSLYIIISIVCLLLAYRFWPMGNIFIFLLTTIVILLLLVLGVLSINKAFSLRLTKKYIASWEKLKTSNASA